MQAHSLAQIDFDRVAGLLSRRQMGAYLAELVHGDPKVIVLGAEGHG